MRPGPQPTIVKRNKLSFNAIAAIGVIDAHGELILCETRPRSYTADSVLAFLHRLAPLMTKPCTLVLDNLACHRTSALANFCSENHISILFNGTYSSQYMPVERLWLFAKLYWRKEVGSISNFKNETLLRRRIEHCIQRTPTQYLQKYVCTCKRRM